MGIGVHHACVSLQGFQFDVDAFFPNLDKHIGCEAVGGGIKGPFCRGEDLHIGKLFQGGQMLFSLEEPGCRLAGIGGHAVIIVGVCRMVGVKDFCPPVLDGGLYELDQLQVGNGVHLDIGEVARIAFLNADDLEGLCLVILEGGRQVDPCCCVVDHRAHSDLMSFLCELMNRCACSQYFIVRVGNYKQNSHMFSPD